MKLRPLDLVYSALVLAVVLLLRDGNAFAYSNWASIQLTGDTAAILKGFNKTPHLLDGLKWFTGPWIHQGAPSYRPLSSFLYWGLLHLGFTHGWQWVTLTTFTMFAAVCILSGLLSLQATKSRLWVIVPPLMAFWQCSSIWCTRTFMTAELSKPLFLLWWPICDSLLCLIFLLSCLIFWLRWTGQGGRWNLAASWLCLTVAVFSKEYAFIAPALLLSATLLQCPPERRKASLWHAVASFGLVLAVVAYRHCVLPQGVLYDPELPWILKHSYLLRVVQIRGAWLDFPFVAKMWDMVDHSGMIGCDLAMAACVAAVGWTFKRTSAHRSAWLSAAWLALSVVPLVGLKFGITEDHSIFPILFALLWLPLVLEKAKAALPALNRVPLRSTSKVPLSEFLN